MCSDRANMEKRINQLKLELNKTAKATGLNSISTLHCSQRLDRLITIYQEKYRKHSIPS